MMAVLSTILAKCDPGFRELLHDFWRQHYQADSTPHKSCRKPYHFLAKNTMLYFPQLSNIPLEIVQQACSNYFKQRRHSRKRQDDSLSLEEREKLVTRFKKGSLLISFLYSSHIDLFAIVDSTLQRGK